MKLSSGKKSDYIVKTEIFLIIAALSAGVNNSCAQEPGRWRHLIRDIVSKEFEDRGFRVVD